MSHTAAMSRVRETPLYGQDTPHKGSRKHVVTLRLDPVSYRKLEVLARAENKTPANYVEAAVLRDMEAKGKDARLITMYVPDGAASLVPGVLLRTDDESDERYAERSALMDKLFAIPDTE